MGSFTDFDAVAARAAGADVVFFGEQHADAVAHRLQRALLETLAGRGRDVVLSLEMFERDVQPVLDDYLAGRLTEAEFLAVARPWPNYATDYRPLVELAKARGWPVVAANVPRRIASRIGREGLAVLEALSPADRALVAGAIDCPRDTYYERFVATMGAHPGPHGGGGAAMAMIERFYEAQCVKDETMAEAIAAALAASPDRPVVHVTGAFHSDFGDGIPARVTRRMPAARIVTLTGVPTADLSAPAIEENRGRADLLLFTRRSGAEGAGR